MTTRYIFTATAGRSGQNSLADIARRYIPGCLAQFEEPQIRPLTKQPFARYERLFRRRFIETHELLGRGRVLEAFVTRDDAALARFAQRRLDWIERKIEGAGAQIHFDVSKYFIRGLHRPIARARPGMTLVRLVRDPILNMRSFLNRDKNFYLDNNRPDAAVNQLRLDPANLEKGELFLWAWCECYLRAGALADEFGLNPIVDIATADLNDGPAMTRAFARLGFDIPAIDPGKPLNRNVANGYGATQVSAKDVELFERFRARLPAASLERLKTLHGYDAREALRRAMPT